MVQVHCRSNVSKLDDGGVAPLLARKRTFTVKLDGFTLAVTHGRLLLHRRSDKRGWFVSVLQFMDYRLEPHKKDSTRCPEGARNDRGG